ncbi:MAG: uroporphyrinogen decarboxylase family protein [Verrucomicrobiae bacterium]|nr:uroporphyrinogen decarboxylase family protein [Verrucomicrobiae bacterium]
MNAMTSRERLQTALKKGKPDRVPLLEFIVDSKVVHAAMPDCHDAADFMDRAGFDGVCCGAQFAKTHEFPDGRYIDEWGVTYLAGPEAVAHPLEGPIRTLAEAKSYTPPDPKASHRLKTLEELVHRYKGRRAICFHHRAAFMWSAYLMGMDNILADFLLEPEKVEIILDKVLNANIALVRRAIRMGAEIVTLGDDYAHNFGPMMSPKIFGHFLLPRLKKMIESIHEEGALCIKHSDGNIYPLLEMIVSAEPDGLNPIEPAAGMDLKTVRQKVGNRVCLVGNIDCSHLLPFGEQKQVRDAVLKAIKDAGGGGGFVLSSSNSIHSACRPENLMTMVRACHEFGAY